MRRQQIATPLIPWLECRCGIAARDKAEPPKTSATVLRALGITDLDRPTPAATQRDRDGVTKRCVEQIMAYAPNCQTG
jgi:hypothetical protein